MDHDYVLVQSELYLSSDAQAEKPDAVVFNGYAAQYAHQPLTATTGQRVRIWLLDAGPNRTTAFHIVGAQFDTIYREGQYQLRATDPGAPWRHPGEGRRLTPAPGTDPAVAACRFWEPGPSCVSGRIRPCVQARW